MSMNFSEFKKLIGADPWSRESETLRARNSTPEFEAAAAEAEAFEEKLQSAMHVQAPSDLLIDIKEITRRPSRSRNWMPLALAASVFVTLGAIGIIWKQSHQWDSVEAYLADHYPHDGPALVARATDFVDQQDVIKVMAKLDTSIGQSLAGNIKFIKICPTPDGRGAHMVVSTEQGPMTIILMPKTQVTDGEVIEFDQMQALMVSLGPGAAAIIGNQSQSIESLQALVRESFIIDLVGA